MRIKKFFACLLAGMLGLLGALPASADFPYLTVTGNPVTAPTAPYITLIGLSGQSGCSVSVSGTFAGSLAIEGFYKNGSAWTPPLVIVSPDGVNSSTSITAVGNYVFNCGTMTSVRVDATSATGSPTVVLNASQGINRILGAGVNGGRTFVVGTNPIQVTNSGNTATVSLATPLSMIFGGTGVSSIASGCVTSNGTTLSSQACPTPGPVPTPVSVQAGTGINVATPSPGVFVVSNTGVLSVAGTGNIASSGGQTPTVSITNAPTFTGQVTAGSYNASNLTTGDCLQSVSGVITSANTACSAGSMAGVVAGNDIVVVGTAPTPTVSVTNSPTFTGTSTHGQIIDSGLTATGCVGTNISKQLVSNSSCVAQVTGSGNIAVTAGPTPNVTITNAPTFTGNVTAGNLTDTSLTSGDCLQSSSGLIVSASTSCPNGSLGGITAGNDIVVTNTNPNSPTVAVTNSPTFTGTATAAHYASGAFGAGNCANTDTVNNQLTTSECNNWPVQSFVIPAVGASVTVTANGTTYFNFKAYQALEITDGTEVLYGHVSSLVTNSSTVGFVLDSIVHGNVGDTMSTSGRMTTAGIGDSPITTGITAGTNITTSTTGHNTTINLSNSPTVTGQVTTTNTGFGFYVGNATIANHPNAFATTDHETPTAMNIDWGADDTQSLESISGKCGAFSRYNSTTLTSTLMTFDCTGNVGMPTLNAGNVIDYGVGTSQCVSANSFSQLGGAGEQCPKTVGNGTRLGGNHTETRSNTAVAGLSTNTFSFGSGYNATPNCVVSNIGSVAPTFSVSAISTTQLTVYNSSAVSQNYEAICIGW